MLNQYQQLVIRRIINHQLTFSTILYREYYYVWISLKNIDRNIILLCACKLTVGQTHFGHNTDLEGGRYLGVLFLASKREDGKRESNFLCLLSYEEWQMYFLQPEESNGGRGFGKQ